MLKGRNILVGVTGSIAAYKSALLVRGLKESGASVQVLMTPAATDFITPLTLSTLSENPVLRTFSDADGNWNNHVELGIKSDAMIIAPATANTIAAMANGLANNLLLTTYLSFRSQVFVAPAMDVDMWAHPRTRYNLDVLAKDGIQIIQPDAGHLASGLEGAGRMAEPDVIIREIEKNIKKKGRLSGRKVLISAGPTREAIDPVRFVSNRSSGQQGVALAVAARDEGADVVLVHGPMQQPIPSGLHKVVPVESAEEMARGILQEAGVADIVIMAAAVADFTVANPSGSKMKKADGIPDISFSRTTDILAALGQKKKNGQLLVGFALETDDEKVHAETKFKTKNLDMIVLNSANEAGAGFENKTNKISILAGGNSWMDFELKDKSLVARDIVDQIIKML